MDVNFNFRRGRHWAMSKQTLEEQGHAEAFCLTEGIHVIESALGERVVRQFLLTGDEGALLIDTGLHSTPLEHIAPYVESIGLDPSQVRYVLTTHADFDHQGGNIAARRLFPRAVFLCHHLDRALIESTDRLIEERYGEFRFDHGIEDASETTAWIRSVSRSETPIDIAFESEAHIRLGAGWVVQVLHTPGHSLGHLSIWDQRSQTAIIADAALWSYLPTRDGRPAFPPTYRYVRPYRQTISLLQALKPSNLLTSHYPLKSGAEVDTFFEESLDFVNRLEECVYREIAESGSALSARDLIERLSPRVGEWPSSAGQCLIYPLIGHLKNLEKSGLVEAHRDGSVVTWSSVPGGRGK
jgi:glyoxylase-like metal-dependent hydrolase (beta-lactamase superfamily II)